MYLLDANVLIEAKNRYYAFDIAPGFWEWLERADSASEACSIRAVYTELVNGNDELARWARGHQSFFRPVDQGTTSHFGPLSTWAASQNYRAAALASFTSNDADYLLVAYAREHQHVVVTGEIPEPASRKRVKIPDACAAMGVAYADTFQMLRRTGARFDLV